MTVQNMAGQGAQVKAPTFSEGSYMTKVLIGLLIGALILLVFFGFRVNSSKVIWIERYKKPWYRFWN